jgi:hypothetical protein
MRSTRLAAVMRSTRLASLMRSTRLAAVMRSTRLVVVMHSTRQRLGSNPGVRNSALDVISVLLRYSTGTAVCTTCLNVKETLHVVHSVFWCVSYVSNKQDLET